MAVERLSGGLLPADGSDPRTFPAIFNAAADVIDAVDTFVTNIVLDDLNDVDVSGVADGDGLVFEGGEWVPGSAGAKGAGGDRVFWENDQAVTASYSISVGQNAFTAGPVSIGTAVTVTIPVGSVWTVI